LDIFHSLNALLKHTLMAAEEFADNALRSAGNFSVNVTAIETPQKPVLSQLLLRRQGLAGAYIPLLLEQDGLQFGLFADKKGCETLARAFLETETEPGMLREGITDAVKEIVNIVSGMLQQRICSEHKLQRGLPVFIDGFIQIPRDQEAVYALIEIGATRLFLILVHSRALPEAHKRALSSQAKLTLEDWFGQTLSAAKLLTHDTLGIEQFSVKPWLSEIPDEDISGAYIPWVGENEGILIVLLAEHKGLLALAKHFLNLGLEDTLLTDEDTSDIVKEILNILSGLLKKQVYADYAEMKRGLPIFVDGVIEFTEGQESKCTLLEVGELKIYLMLIRKKPCHIKG